MSADYFEQLFRAAPFGYLITDRDDVIVRVNETLLRWTGFESHEMLDRPFRDFLAPGTQLLYETRHLPVLRLQGVAHEVFLQLVRADGELLPVLINAERILAPDGSATEVRIGVLDASARVSYERELLSTQRSAQELAARVSVLQNASTAFAGTSSESQITETLASLLEDALVASSSCVALLNGAGELEVIAGVNPLDGLVRGENLLGSTVLEFGMPQLVSATEYDADRYPAVVEALREARLQTVAVFPIMNDATPIGVAAAFFGRERSIDATEADMVLAVARQASQGLTRLRAQEELAYAAEHDQLTGLPNRALIRESISDALGGTLSVMFIDLDGFKPVNDRLGHHVGDDILREVSRRLIASVRASDIVGRYGGDEFVVICVDTDRDDAAAISGRIREVVRGAFSEAAGFAISASIGIVVHTEGDAEVSTDELLGAADAAMYESKRLGRDRTTVVRV